MAEHHCNTCNMKKDETMFTNFGKECAECKKKRLTGKREEYYQNRTRCICGVYISDGYPKERHEKTKGHINFMKCGNRFPKSLEYLVNTGQEANYNKVSKAIFAGQMRIKSLEPQTTQ